MFIRRTLFALAAATLLPCAAFAQAEAAAPELSPADIEKASYIIGRNLGNNLKNSGLTPDISALGKGVKDAMEGKTSMLSDEESSAVMGRVQKYAMSRQEAEKAKLGAQAEAEGAAFLAKNGQRPEVKTTASGLQYEVLTAVPTKSGKKRVQPKASNTVKVHYKGTLLSGETFDSSYDRGEPATFPLDGVIPGWTEGVQLMAAGEKYRFYIPSKLGYGESGAGTKIPPNTMLTFEVELLSIEK